MSLRFMDLSLEELRELDESMAAIEKSKMYHVNWDAFLRWVDGANILPDNFGRQIKFLKEVNSRR